jgi:hypothetical protein
MTQTAARGSSGIKLLDHYLDKNYRAVARRARLRSGWRTAIAALPIEKCDAVPTTDPQAHMHGAAAPAHTDIKKWHVARQITPDNANPAAHDEN